MRSIALATVLLVCAGCGFVDRPVVAPEVEPRPLRPVSEPIGPPGVDADSHAQIPDDLFQILINGKLGYPGSWSWKGDWLNLTMTDPAFAEAVAAPFELEVPPDTMVVGIRAIAPGVPGERDVVLLAESGTDVGEVPAGSIMLSVAVRFREAGGAEYYWALNRPAGTPPIVPETP